MPVPTAAGLAVPSVAGQSGAMVLHCEAFYDGDRQTGVLLRDDRPGELATLIAFQLESGEIYRAEQVTEVGAGPAEWTRFRFAEASSGVVTIGVRSSDAVNVGGVLLDREAVPSYLGWRILVDLASRDGGRVAFRQLDEHGEPVVHDAELLARAGEEVTLPGVEGVVLAQRYDMLLDGDPYTSFWWDGESVVASDWTAGSMSVRVDDLEAALASCPVLVAEAAREWVAGRP